MSKKTKKIPMQMNGYLEDLGLELYEYGVNWNGDYDKKTLKEWKRQRKRYGFDSRETYSVYSVFAEWLYSHLMMYMENASKIVDLTYHSFEFEGKTYTLEEAIGKIIKWTGYFIKNYECLKGNKSMNKLKKAARLWAEILPYVWW